jgi:hypothetical protein
VRILLDECLPRKLGNLLINHEVRTAPQMGWASLKNGQLLSRAEEQFDVFITIDSNLSYQQNIERYKIGVVVIKARSNKLQDIRPLVSEIMRAIQSATPSMIVGVGT